MQLILDKNHHFTYTIYIDRPKGGELFKKHISPEEGAERLVAMKGLFIMMAILALLIGGSVVQRLGGVERTISVVTGESIVPDLDDAVLQASKIQLGVVNFALAHGGRYPESLSNYGDPIWHVRSYLPGHYDENGELSAVELGSIDYHFDPVSGIADDDRFTLTVRAATQGSELIGGSDNGLMRYIPGRVPYARS